MMKIISRYFDNIYNGSRVEDVINFLGFIFFWQILISAICLYYFF